MQLEWTRPRVMPAASPRRMPTRLADSLEAQAQGRTAAATLRAWLRTLPYGMLATRGDAGAMDSRPLQTLDIDDAGSLWFFRSKRSLKVGELARDARVCLSYADVTTRRFVSVSGHATILDDRARAAALWSPSQTLFYPAGIDDPDLALLRVRPTHARAWNGNESWLGLVRKLGRALLRGEASDIGQHAELRWVPAATDER